MPSLAAPRGQKKWVLLPRGKPLYEDTNSFGTRMLTKMGWSQGKGLGANEDGSQNFIQVKYKNDVGGVGFEHRDDQWTEHENVFNSLLQKLATDKTDNTETTTTTIEETTSDPKSALSGESLEVKSKQSRARVHYQKFTRGKDLTRYSNKDLANIFGKKSLVEDSESAKVLPFGIFTENVNNLFEKPEDKSQEESSFGITTINTGTSSNDYFREKMEKRKRNHETPVTEVSDNIDLENIEETKVSKKKRKKQKPVIEEEEEELEEETKKEEIVDVEEITERISKKKSKKSKKKQSEHEHTEEPLVVNLDSTIDELQTEEVKVKKSKKKNKKAVDEDCEIIEETKVDKINEEIVSKVNKTKKKNKIPKAVETIDILEDVTEDNHMSYSNEINKENEENKMDISKINTEDNSNKTIITISGFLVEKFRHLNVEDFVNSNLCNIVGYGIDDNFEVKVVHAPKDNARISELWNKVLQDKYKEYDCETLTKSIQRKKYFKRSANIHRKRKEKLFKFI